MLENVPRLADVEQLQRILGNHGVDSCLPASGRATTQISGQTLHISRARDIVDTTAPYELVSKMRASFWVIGAAAGAHGRGEVSLPGGCAIGTRPVDLLPRWRCEQLGAEIDIDGGYVDRASAKGGLRGARDRFSQGLGRRHPCRADGGDARQGRDRDRERRARARDRRPRRLPHRDGREDRRRRHVARSPIEGVDEAARRAPHACCPTASRPAPTPWRSR